jgi:hypothetical protein
MVELQKPPSRSYVDDGDTTVWAYVAENTDEMMDYARLCSSALSDNTRVRVGLSSDSPHWRAAEDVAWQTAAGALLGAASGAPNPIKMLVMGTAAGAVGLLNGVRTNCYGCHVYGK